MDGGKQIIPREDSVGFASRSWLFFLNCPALQQQPEAGNSMGMEIAQHDIFTGRSGGGSGPTPLPREDLVTSTCTRDQTWPGGQEKYLLIEELLSKI